MLKTRSPRLKITPDAKRKLKICVGVLESKQMKDIVILNLVGLFPLSDFFIISTYQSLPQRDSVISELLPKIKHNGYKVLRVEGNPDGKWTVVDIDDTVLHLFDSEAREYYNLEGLWFEAKRVDTKTVKRWRVKIK